MDVKERAEEEAEGGAANVDTFLRKNISNHFGFFSPDSRYLWE